MLVFLSSLALAVPCSHKLLSTLPSPKLTHLRNTVMARNGYRFGDAELQASFESKSWYKASEDNNMRYSESDKTCLGRLEMWERNRRLLFEGKANLGKGEDEVPIYLLSHRPAFSRERLNVLQCARKCSLLLIVGDDSIEIPAYWLEGTDQAKVEARIVDIVSSDQSKEFWVISKGPSSNPPTYNRFVTYVEGDLALQELNGTHANSGDILLSDNGRLALDDQSCSQRIRTWYELQNGILEQVSQEKSSVAPKDGCSK